MRLHSDLPRVLVSALVLLALVSLVSTFSPPAHAAIGLIVTKTADTNDGTCDADCSLREAIAAANANTPLAETITFNIPMMAGCTAANVCTITLGSTLPGINDDVTIDGSANSADITVSGNNAVQALGVLSGKTLSLNNLTIANGYCPVAGCGGVGGGIINIGTLNIANSTFNSNNSALFGGGIYNGTGGTVNIANSTFSGNSAASNGGGILNNTGGTVNIANSTLYGNTATGHGGGIVNFGTVNLKNSILSGNTAGAGTDDCANSATLNGSNNLIDGTTCGASAGRIGAVTNFDTTLANNGGPTKTHKLNGGSNALEAVPSGQCTYLSSGTNPLFSNGATIPTDQRGVIRPQNTLCDVGAYELLFCSPGSYDNGSATCAPAPQGYYVAVFGATAATPCDPGYFQSGTGAVLCNQATAGNFVPVAASISQTPCPSGSDSAAGATVCYQTGPSFVVNDASDTNDTACDALPGDCTLREAINAANALAGADTITFNIPDDAGLLCSGNNACIITLSALGTLPAIDDDVTIDGAPNNGDITVDGASTYRVMIVNSGKSLSLNTLTIADGKSINYGGGIQNYGTLNVTNSTFSGNSAGNGGGGIYNGGTVNVTNSTFSGNSAGTGGGIHTGLAVNVTNSTFSGNSASYGGGIYIELGSVNVTNSTFSGNSAPNGGGGISNDDTLNVTNSTFSGNSATTYGGGISNTNFGTATLRNSIIANSTSGSDCYVQDGSLTADAFNLDSDGSCGGATTSGSINLAALADNGGPTFTMKLQSGSDAINTGDNTVCGNAVGSPNYGAGGKDQRGETRPQGLFCDVGAYELVYTGFQSGPNFVVNSAADTNDNSCDTLGQGIGNKDCTLREAINAANGLAGADTITFDIPNGGACSPANTCTITLGSTLPAINDNVTVDGAPNSGDITVSGNNSVTVMQVNNGKTLTVNALAVVNGKTIGNGGGIFNGTGTLNVTNSAFSGNSAAFNGGALLNNGGTLNVTNSTFFGNSATTAGSGKGGGIYSYNGTLTVTNSTLSGNSATNSGGGIFNDVGTTTLRNSIIANSTTGGDCYNNATLTADAYNLDSDGTCDNATQKTVPEIALGALQNNGGTTDTMALGNSSVAIDAGNDAVCAAAVGDPTFGAGGLDQRGEPRDDLQCDVGAFEFVQSDGDTIFKSFSTAPSSFTFGPTLADMLLNTGSPLTLMVQRTLSMPPNSPPAGVLPITWDASTKASQFSLLVTLCYDPVTHPVDPDTLHVWHYDTSLDIPMWVDLGGTSDNSHPPYACVTAATPLSTLSPLALAPGAPTATNVTGVKGLVSKNGNPVLRWKTTTETQIAGFNIYRQGKQGEWKQINSKFRQAKHAGAALGDKYRYIDRKANADKTYRYKIEIVYLDGHTEWTNVIRVNVK